MEDKNPVVIARLGRDPSKRTVAFYGHYDVQPAMEREWTTNPFEMNAIDGYYYGRGTSDNKVCLRCAMAPHIHIDIEAAVRITPSHSVCISEAVRAVCMVCCGSLSK